MENEPAAPKQGPIQEILGNRITKFVVWGTVIVGVIGVGFSFAYLWGSADPEKAKTAFSFLQYIFGALIPLWGTWIGTILAYYYSEKSFNSANQSVQKLVDKLTSDQKLESVKASDVMINRDHLIVQVFPTGKDLSMFALKEDCIDFIEKNKIKRVILLDENGRAKYVIHRDLISYFIASYTLSGNAVANFTLKDMYEKGSAEIRAVMDNSVGFVSPDATLLSAKKIMDQNPHCQDVFVTKTGNGAEPILGWVTNVTISQNSIV